MGQSLEECCVALEERDAGGGVRASALGWRLLLHFCGMIQKDTAAWELRPGGIQ